MKQCYIPIHASYRSMIPATASIRTRLRLRHLQLILAVWEHGSLRRASDEIGMTQPAATKALHELEDLLGVTLFERHARGIDPTIFGEAVIRYARVVFADLGTLREELVAIESGNVGAVRLGAVMAPSPDLLTTTIVALKEAHPKLHITVQIDTSDVLVQALQEDQLDLVVGRVPNGWPADDLTFETTGEEPLSLVTRPRIRCVENAAGSARRAGGVPVDHSAASEPDARDHRSNLSS